MAIFRATKGEPLGTTVVNPNAAGDVALTLQPLEPASGQTGDMLQIQNSAGTVLTKVDKSGIISAPADGILLNGNKVAPQEAVVVLLPAAGQSVASTIFIADRAYQVTGINEAHTVASSSGTMDVLKCTGTQAPSAGTTLMTGTISTAGAANTVLAGVLTATVGTLQLAAGDRIGINPGGTQTNLAGCALQIMLKAI